MTNTETVLKNTLATLNQVVANLAAAGIAIDDANAPSSGDHSKGAPPPPLDPKTNSAAPIIPAQEVAETGKSGLANDAGDDNTGKAANLAGKSDGKAAAEAKAEAAGKGTGKAAGAKGKGK